MTALIREDRYEENMKNRVEPALAAKRETIELTLRDGGTLHGEAYANKEAKRAVVLVHGYTENAEKYREMVWYFVQAGFAIFAYDQRGHGYSCRTVADESITHVERFSDYVEDLREFIDKVVTPRAAGQELVVYAHSMGGAVAGEFLMTYPGVFTRALLNSPMIEPKNGPYPRWVNQALSGIMCALGKGKERAFTGHPYCAERETFERSLATSRARFDYYQNKRNAIRQYQNCSPSYSWGRAAFGVTDMLLDPENCKKIRIPLLLMQASDEFIVSTEAQDKFVALVPGAKKIVVQAKHESYSSVDSVMEGYLNDVIGFLSE